MKSLTAHVPLSRCLLGLFLTFVTVPAIHAAEEPAAPNTVLLDTGSTLVEPWTAAALAKKTGWKAVPEDNLIHRFQGDVAAINDRAIVVLRAKGAGAEVYGQTAAGPKLRVLLSPLGSSATETPRLASVRIVENNPGAVMLTATFAVDGKPCSLTYRLTAGQMIVETRPGEGVERLLVQGAVQYVVVPDFFGDDLVFPAATITRARWRLPTENFFLNLMDQGAAQVMCLWQSRRQEAVAVRSAAGQTPGISGCEIQAIKDKPIWIALLEGTDLWHSRTVSADDAKTATTLAWKPPFPAKWRADLLGPEGLARSWYFHGPETSSEPSSSGDRTHPCCLEADRAVLQLNRDNDAALSAWRYPTSLVVYAMDRDRATPLTTFCPIDVLRNTLGVGPCQYVLQTEGLSAEANPTPDDVATWVERQFKRKKQGAAADEIRERLEQMVQHVKHAQARIEQYARLAREIRELCKAQRREAQATIADLAARLEQAAGAAAVTPALADQAARLAAEMAALIGKRDALDECQRIGGEIRAVGAVQDRALSNCRMTLRWLKQSAIMIAEDDPQQAPWVNSIRERTERVLEPH